MPRGGADIRREGRNDIDIRPGKPNGKQTSESEFLPPPCAAPIDNAPPAPPLPTAAAATAADSAPGAVAGHPTIPADGQTMTAARLSRQTLALPDVRQDKIAVVKSALANGSYNIRASELATKVLDSMVRRFMRRP